MVPYSNRLDNTKKKNYNSVKNTNNCRIKGPESRVKT